MQTPVIQGDLPPMPEQPKVILASGDEVEVKFQYWPELDDTQTIRPDGQISLPMVDDIQAAGKSPQELDAYLTELYQMKLKDPVITVIVRTLVSQRIFVGGEVQEPGPIALEGRMDLLGAIMAAGGFINLSADPANVIVFRHQDNKRYACC